MFASNTKSTLDLLPDPKTLVRLPTLAARARNAAQRLRDDKSGSTMMIFGLTLFPVFFFVGVSVDFSRVLTARSKSLAMADAAGLAAGRSFQTGTAYAAATPPNGSKLTCAATSGSVSENAQRAACNYLQSTASKNVVQSIVDFPDTSSSAEFTVRTTTWIQTPFLAAGSHLVKRAAEANAPAGCAAHGWQCQKVVTSSTVVVASGGNAEDGVNIEVAMMIDVTGSMAESDGANSTKIATVKKAAKDAIDIMIWNDQSNWTSKIALAPFSQRVNVGSYASAVTGLPATMPSNGSNKLRACVTERTGTDAYTDAAPAANKWIGAFAGQSGLGQNSSTDSSNFRNNSTNCGSSDPTSTEAIIPLTTDKAALKAQIDTLSPGGGTAGHLGTAWAWYLISPKWSTIWPTVSVPAPYVAKSVVKPSLRKYAILMTDGDYNTDYSSASSFDQARELCDGMKDANIEVFTIGAQVSDAAKTFLKRCAGKESGVSDPTRYYDATDGIKLQQAFRDIALKISSLRVSK
jgi:Flp pilus assembly protein TadG